MKKALLFLMTIVVIPSLQGCKEPSFAKVSCNNVEKFESSSGVLNVGLLKYGNVIALNTATKSGNYLLTIPITDNDITPPDQPIDTFAVLTNTSFEIQLSGDVSKDPNAANLKAQAQTTITNNTMFFLKNSVRKNLKNPTEKINADPSSLQTIQRTNKPEIVFMLVSGIVYADEFKFLVKQSATVNGKANVISVGNFEVQVDYECQGSVNVNAKSGGLFFKPSFFTYDNATNKMIPLVGIIDLSKYNLSYGLMSNAQ